MNDLPVRYCVCVIDLNFESNNQVGRSVDETLRLVQAFQYTEEHGEGSGTSDKGPSEIGTTSLQRTLVAAPC